MIPKLYESDVDDVTASVREGIGRLPDALSCNVIEERNGQYELSLVYPVDSFMFKEIQTGRIIRVKPNDTSDEQNFRIYKITSTINGRITVNAHHISYDLSGIPVAPFTATGASNAMNGLLTNALESVTGWSVYTDLTNTTTQFAPVVPKSFRANLGGSEGSILDVFGGEFEWDNHTVKLWSSRGADNGVRIEYGKNLTDLNKEDSGESTYTGVLAYWTDDETSVYSDVQYVTNHANYGYERIYILDASSDYENTPTKAELNQRAASYRDSHNVGVPRVSIKASFVPLWQSEEYKDLAPLEHVSLCDTVTVYYPLFDVDVQTKVISYDYDVLKERYRSISLGDARSTLADTILQQTSMAGGSGGGSDLRIIRARISDVAPVSGTATATFTGLPSGQNYHIVEALSKPHGSAVWHNNCGINEQSSSVVLTATATANTDFMLLYTYGGSVEDATATQDSTTGVLTIT